MRQNSNDGSCHRRARRLGLCPRRQDALHGSRLVLWGMCGSKRACADRCSCQSPVPRDAWHSVLPRPGMASSAREFAPGGRMLPRSTLHMQPNSPQTQRPGAHSVGQAWRRDSAVETPLRDPAMTAKSNILDADNHSLWPHCRFVVEQSPRNLLEISDQRSAISRCHRGKSIMRRGSNGSWPRPRPPSPCLTLSLRFAPT